MSKVNTEVESFKVALINATHETMIKRLEQTSSGTFHDHVGYRQYLDVLQDALACPDITDITKANLAAVFESKKLDCIPAVVTYAVLQANMGNSTAFNNLLSTFALTNDTIIYGIANGLERLSHMAGNTAPGPNSFITQSIFYELFLKAATTTCLKLINILLKYKPTVIVSEDLVSMLTTEDNQKPTKFTALFNASINNQYIHLLAVLFKGKPPTISTATLVNILNEHDQNDTSGLEGNKLLPKCATFPGVGGSVLTLLIQQQTPNNELIVKYIHAFYSHKPIQALLNNNTSITAISIHTKFQQACANPNIADTVLEALINKISSVFALDIISLIQYRSQHDQELLKLALKKYFPNQEVNTDLILKEALEHSTAGTVKFVLNNPYLCPNAAFYNAWQYIYELHADNKQDIFNNKKPIIDLLMQTIACSDSIKKYIEVRLFQSTIELSLEKDEFCPNAPEIIAKQIATFKQLTDEAYRAMCDSQSEENNAANQGTPYKQQNNCNSDDDDVFYDAINLDSLLSSTNDVLLTGDNT